MCCEQKISSQAKKEMFNQMRVCEQKFQDLWFPGVYFHGLKKQKTPAIVWFVSALHLKVLKISLNQYWFVGT